MDIKELMEIRDELQGADAEELLEGDILENVSRALREAAEALLQQASPRQEAGPAQQVESEPEEFADYDSGVLNDFGGGNVGWWQDYIRAEVDRANAFWREQTGPEPLYLHPPHPSAQVPELLKALVAEIRKNHVFDETQEGRIGERFFNDALDKISAKAEYFAPSIAQGEKREPVVHDQLIFAGYTNGAQILYANEDGEGAFYKDTANDCCIPLYMLKIHGHRLESTTGGEITIDRIRAAQQQAAAPESSNE